MINLGFVLRFLVNQAPDSKDLVEIPIGWYHHTNGIPVPRWEKIAIFHILLTTSWKWCKFGT